MYFVYCKFFIHCCSRNGKLSHYVFPLVKHFLTSNIAIGVLYNLDLVSDISKLYLLPTIMAPSYFVYVLYMHYNILHVIILISCKFSIIKIYKTP